ncbi:hypothetical protein L249_4934 [Ophiocordyceps polyrhachis-furcata BCC 54312]|uniref:NADH dehydrogenase [ubiquinone] iron-sulfur protein 4, mitochondrial n=1 Tax=Ophiocordyceps polyrhachis-furcata BCC 54312 TaxID=1330021 RepID=A0A367L3D6_9HYPO|nr:hypothetical protein L249_4934 [Ophiocordyceps polyrhachis-furcata BCC 54312]
MASIRILTARRLWQTAAASSRAPRLSATRRFESAVATRPETLPAVPAPTQPDYDIPPDKATSTFTPVPKQIQEGNEDVLTAGMISGAPMELQARTVRIYKESKPATQSGDFRGHHWRVDWDILPKGHRWENELIGWQSSGDFMQGTHLNFETKEDAIRFADKQGYSYFVQEPCSRKFTPKAYANNFLYSPKKLKHIRTK